jgi:hypothetical protein
MANTTTSRTSLVAADVVIHAVGGSKDGVQCYLKYTKGSGGTNVSIQFTFICRPLSTTDEYQPIYLAAGVPTVLTYVFTASGNYRIPVPLARGETTVKATLIYTGGTASAAVVDFRNE